MSATSTGGAFVGGTSPRGAAAPLLGPRGVETDAVAPDARCTYRSVMSIASGTTGLVGMTTSGSVAPGIAVDASTPNVEGVPTAPEVIRGDDASVGVTAVGSS